MSSACENCHRCRSTASLTPTLSGELLCPNCHSDFVEQLLSNRSTPSPIPIASPPTSLSQPLFPSFSGTEFGPTNSRNLSTTNLSNVLDQQPASGHRRRNFLNLDVDAVLEQMRLQGIDIHRDGTPPAARSAVEDLPDVKVNAEISQSECAVCKVGFDYGMEVKQMPCNHLYHNDCLLPWLNLRNTCPLCRFELATDDPFSSVGSIGSENPSGGSGSESSGVSGSENPPEPGVSGSENQAVSDDENIGGSGLVPGSGFGA